jgi:hypothetical protein
MPESDKDLIESLERQIAEGKELEGYSPVKARVSKNLSVTYAIRLSPGEYSEFSAAAKARNMTLADFMRAAARGVVTGEIDVTKAAAIGTAREKVRELAEALRQL